VVWDVLLFLLNGFIFILIGLQLPDIIKQLSNYKLSELIGYGLLVSLATIGVRIIWVLSGAWLSRRFSWKKKISNSEKDETWKNVVIVAWTGTRGVISMAAALALPLTQANGTAFPQRPLILFLCFVVIFVTLVVQGLSLPLLVKLLKVKPSVNEDREETELQLHLVNSTLHFIDNEYSSQLTDRTRKELKIKYEQSAGRLVKEIKVHKQNEKQDTPLPVRSLTPLQEAQADIRKFQRDLLLQLHKNGEFSDEAIKQVERDLDIDDLKKNQLLPKDV
jgi:CPA1 family monovalent cation:H+ antiporter